MGEDLRVLRARIAWEMRDLGVGECMMKPEHRRAYDAAMCGERMSKEDAEHFRALAFIQLTAAMAEGDADA